MCRLVLRVVSFAALLLLLCFVSTPCRAEGTKWAVLVGIDKYRNKNMSSLNCAVADVKAVARTLVENDGFPANQVFTMTSDVQEDNNPDCPTNTNVFDRLSTLAENIAPEDTFLFFFAGHGFQKGEGSEFLGTINADPTSLYSLKVSTVPLHELREQMKNVKAGKVIFMIDACRNDPTAGGRGSVPNKQTATFTRDLQIVASSANSGPSGTAVLFACSEGQRSWEWPEEGHGMFTYFLLQGLKGKAAESSGAITMTSLGKYLQQQMRDWGLKNNLQQTPDLEQQGAAEIVLGHVTHGGGDVPVDTVAQLNINTEPAGAEVFVDGQDQGKTTPCTLVIDLGVLQSKQVEIGTNLQGYKALVQAVTLNRGANLPLSWPLQPGPQPITPVPVPPGQPTTQTNPKDGAVEVYVPAGPFTMGSTEAEVKTAVQSNAQNQPDWFENEEPQRQVTLDGYYIYKTLVTVGQYRKFCAATGRAMPPEPGWGWKDDHPVVNVSWHDAKAYCDWAGVDLPTEAQWEKAARGTDGRIYPWGNDWDPNKLWGSVRQQRSETSAAGSYPGGASPYGCLHMAGNVLQWCADWFDENYYQYAPTNNPVGPATGALRVSRGSHLQFASSEYYRCAKRNRELPDHRDILIGFRCVARVVP